MATEPHRVVIVGGGFAGLHAAQSLRQRRTSLFSAAAGAFSRLVGRTGSRPETPPVQVTLVDRHNYHLFQPLLYQVATGGLSPANIAAPLRAVLRRQKNAVVLLGEATGVDVEGRRLILRDGQVDYDTLVIAAGGRHSYFGHNEWEPFAPGLKTIEDATTIRSRILLAFESAEREKDPQKRRAWMTFVIVGGGPTGVELAGALAEIARHTLKYDFRNISPPDATVIVVDAGERTLAAYPPDLSDKAVKALRRLGVTPRVQTMVTEVQPDHVVLTSNDESEILPTRTVLWAAGVQSSPLSQVLADAAGAELDRSGRVIVEPDLTLPGHPELFVVGDMACFTHQTGSPLPGLAPVAIQQGRYVADVIQRRLRGEPVEPFRYKDYGTMATIGRSAAVVHLGRFKSSGFVAWVIWLFVHLMQLVRFENRLLVLLQWSWNYFTFNRSARLITGQTQQPAAHNPADSSSPSE